MKNFKNCAAQGDLLITRIDTIPDVAETPAENGEHIVAHSETGHHHVINSERVRHFRVDDFVSYIEVGADAKLTHKRNFDTHGSIKLSEGKYRLNRQREYVAGAFQRATD